MSLHVAVLGASGHVGSRVVRRLLGYDAGVVGRVHVLNRRELPDGVFPSDPRLAVHTVDMSSGDTLERACTPILDGVDVVVATMGIGSGRGTLDEFRLAEVELPSGFARAAVAAGASRAVLLTAVGTNIEKKWSALSMMVAKGQYFHLKGVVEKNFSEAGFGGGVVILRPGGLLGTNHLPHWVDGVVQRLDWMLPTNYRCAHIDRLATLIARIAVSKSGAAEVRILGGEELQAEVGSDRMLPEP